MQKIFVAICSCNKDKSVELRSACRRTWISKIPEGIDYRFFVGRNYTGNETDVIQLDVDDSYIRLPNKVRLIYEWVNCNVNYDYVFKCDDDSYVILDRLKELIIDNHDFIGNEFLKNDEKKFASGGAGYFLSKKILNNILKCYIPIKGLEDVIFSKLALKNTDNYSATTRLHADPQGFCDDGMVSAHWLTVDQMIKNHEKLTNLKTRIY